LPPHNPGVSLQKLPSTREIPPVTLSNIPHTDASVFHPYLAQTESLFETFTSTEALTDDRQSYGTKAVEKGDQQLSVGSSTETLKSKSVILSLSGVDNATSASRPLFDVPRAQRRTSSGLSRKIGRAVAPLRTVPQVFLESDFHLENPRTFDVVSEKSEITRPATTNGLAGLPEKKALASNAILQEKLSWYMDIVECHLISSISSASTSFFAALGSLRDLHFETAQSIAKIKILREDLGTLDQRMAHGGVRIVHMSARQKNAEKLADAVDQIQDVLGAVRHCKEQVGKGEIEAALEELSYVEDLIAGSSSDLLVPNSQVSKFDRKQRLLDLRGVSALEGVSIDIAMLKKRIGQVFEEMFIDTLLHDIRRHIESVSSAKTFQRWNQAYSRFRPGHVRTPTGFPAYLQIDDSLRSKLLTQLRGLGRSDSIMHAAIAYREAILREVKGIIRRHIPSSSDEDANSTSSTVIQGKNHMSQQEKSSSLARTLRALDPASAEEIFQKVYSSVGEALRRLGTQLKVLMDITSSLSDAQLHSPLGLPVQSPRFSSIDDRSYTGQHSRPLPGILNQEELQQALDLSSLLGQAVDIAQAQVIKILKVRTDQSTSLPLSSFLRYFTLNRLFADECEAVSGRGGIAFKTLVNDHIKAYISYLGDREKQALIQIMDADTWDAKDFAEDPAMRLSRILESSARDIDAWTGDLTLWNDETTATQHHHGDGTSLRVDSRDKLRSAVIGDQKYILSDSALALLRGVETFEHLMTGIPSMSSEVTGLLLDYIKLFNSRSSQLILGAGATRSAGLKNITTKHLALSSQTLGFVLTLIPHVREFVRRQAPNNGSLMVGIDKIKRLLQDHQTGIHDKLVDIMTGRAAAHVNSMKKIDWNEPVQNDTTSAYMEILVRETATLHKVLSRHLPETTVRLIMTRVFASYGELWGPAYRSVHIKTPAAKDR
jgi:vacuolar protein sorting-associated protein 54